MTWQVKRIHDAAHEADGARFLVDRLWPRGVSKEKAALTAWLKPLSPSDELRLRYHGATADSDEAWQDFLRDYAAELASGDPAVMQALAALDAARAAGPVTLLYAARNEERNNAVALRRWLDARG
jgi:uncharacterized protein YeaO (DUF488 family)